MSVSPPPPPISSPPHTRSSHTSMRASRRVCRCADLLGFDKREIATVLSIAHLTGWSAELIANKMHEHLGTNISPEKVWDTYKQWEDARNETWLSGPTWEEDLKTTKDMVDILKKHAIKPDFHARPLSQTPRPISVPFSILWYPQNDDSIILDNFTVKTRKACINVLSWRKEDEHLATPTPQELPVMNKLGSYVVAIMEELLPRWTNEQIKLNKQLPFPRSIEVSLENVQVIGKYVRLFEQKWEEIYGKMDGTNILWLLLDRQPRFEQSLSTGDAAKSFFRQMLLTRLQAMEERRLAWRKIIGFEETPLNKLPKDIKDCHICQQPLGVPDEDGNVEMPIQVVACCGNFFGGNCLRRWYGEFENGKCPLCKWTASTSFLEKLCYEGTEDELDDDDDLDQESAMAQMGSVRASTPDVNIDSEDEETGIDTYGRNYREFYINGNGELEDEEIKE